MEEIYNKIEEKKLTREEREIINEYICNISSEIISKEEFEKLRNKYKERGGSNMLVETLKREIRIESKKRGDKIGKKEGKKLGIKMAKEREKEIVYKMLKQNADINFIKKCTKLSEEEIEELRKNCLRKK